MESSLISLMAVLAPIALLDSISMVPLSIVPVALILGNRHAVTRAAGFLLGILLSYFCGGLLLLFGLDALLERIEPALRRWGSNPSSAELLLQLIIGLILLVFASRIGNTQGKPKQQDEVANLSPVGWMMFSMMLTVGGLPGAVPYLGAVDQILRADLPQEAAIAALGFYNLVFMLPLTLLFVLPSLFPARSEAFFGSLGQFFERYGPRVLAVVLAAVGLVFALDAVGFYLGYPLLPVVA